MHELGRLGGFFQAGHAGSIPVTRSTVETPAEQGSHHPAVLFGGLTLHGSGPNRSGTPRVGMHARYCHPEVRMVTQRNKPVLVDRHSWMVLGEAGPGAFT
jgi:ectoine hydroxylase-related dioxygenase (phytanoyl-CoA dioxygenase family)